MSRNPNDLPRLPLSAHVWQFEAFKAAAESDRHAATRYTEAPVSRQDRRWIERGRALGRQLQAFTQHTITLLQQLAPAKRRRPG